MTVVTLDATTIFRGNTMASSLSREIQTNMKGPQMKRNSRMNMNSLQQAVPAYHCTETELTNHDQDVFSEASFNVNPGWGSRLNQTELCPDRRWTGGGGGGAHNTRCSYESLANARKSADERTNVCLMHESLDTGSFRLGRSGHTVFGLKPQPGNVGCFIKNSFDETWCIVFSIKIFFKIIE